MEQEKSLQEQMLEAIRQAHWQSTPSESKIAAKRCAILACEYFLEKIGSIYDTHDRSLVYKEVQEILKLLKSSE